MKMLNGEKLKKYFGTVESNPDIFSIDVKDKRFYIDSNSLKVLEDDNKDGDFSNISTEIFGVNWKPSFPLYGNPIVRYMVLEITHDCNLKCDYCFVRSNYDDKGIMTFAVAKKAIDSIMLPMRQKNTELRLGFFGGEPLLNWGLIEEVVQYIDGLENCKGRYHITTNGMLLDEKKIKFLNENNFSLIVSIDGPQDIHDRHRKNAGGTGSWEKIINNLKMVKGTPLAKRITLRGTFLSEEGIRLLDRVKYLNELCDEGYASAVSVEPACLVEQGCKISESKDFTVETVKDLQGEYLEVADWMISRIKEGKPARFKHLEFMVSRLLYSTPYSGECGAGKGFVSVSHDGSIFACHREAHTKIGGLDTGGIDEEKRAMWMDNRYYARDKCPQYPIRNACGGGCREEGLGKYGDIRKPYEVSCEFKYNFLRGSLWILSSIPYEILCKIFKNPFGKKGDSPKPKILKSWVL